MRTSLLVIGDTVRNGIVFDIKNWGRKMMNGDDLAAAIERLFSLLRQRQVDYVLVGGVALLQYVAGRNTQDIDLIMALPALEAVPEIQLTQRDEYFVRGVYDGLQLDILLTTNRLFAHVQNAHAAPRSFAESTIMTATVEGLVLLKLFALPSLYRQGDFVKVGIYENDIATLLRAYQPDTAAILDELGPFLDKGDLEEVRGIVEELKGRFARFGRA